MSLVVWCVLLCTGSSPLQDDRYGNRFFSESGCDEARLKAAIDEVRGSSKVPQLSAKLYRTFKLQTATHSYFCSNRQDERRPYVVWCLAMFSWWFLLCCAYIHDLRSSQVTSQNPESTYEALKTYGTDLTSMAREGKLDPVIGRDDEIRRVTWTKMENMKTYEKKILFKIVQKGSSECYVYTRSVFPCVFPCFARLQGPRC